LLPARTNAQFCIQAAVNVLATVAQQGHEDPAEAQAALDAGKALLGKGMAGAEIDVTQKITVGILDQSLDVLFGLNGESRRKLLLAT
jgi:hypothetical protein